MGASRSARIKQTKKVMKKHKYFSQLTPKQKDKASRLYLYARLNLLGINSVLRRSILLGIDFDKIISIKDEIVGQKMFYFEKTRCYVPVKFNELVNN